MGDKMTKISRNILDGIRERYPDWYISKVEWVQGEIIATLTPKRYDENGNEVLVNGYDKGYGYSDE